MDITLLQQNITKLLKITEEEQKQALRKFSKMTLESRIKVFTEHRSLFYTLKNEHMNTDPPLLSYASLILAINQYINNIAEIDKNTLDIRAKSIRKFAKRERLLSKWALIQELKNVKDLSFRQIAQYLKKYHKLDVVHSTIHGLWKELENNKEMEK